jgi:hypothetical protein
MRDVDRLKSNANSIRADIAAKRDLIRAADARGDSREARNLENALAGLEARPGGHQPR